MSNAKARKALGVDVLSADESRALEKASLNQFAHLSSGRISWDGVPATAISFKDEDDGVRVLSERLREFVEGDAGLVVFWGTLVMPTVTMPVRLALEHAGELVREAPDFWIFMQSRKTLVEFMQDGIVTVASVP
jgi:hypothetical protein